MEQFDLIDEHDNVIGATDKPTSHALRLPHRVAVVYVFNQHGELYIQVHKASGGKLDHSAGGHVRRGEGYAAAARREMKEELGLDQPLAYISKIYRSAGSYCHMFGVFECIAAKGWEFIPNYEVEEIFPMKLEEVRKMMEESPEKFTGGFRDTMKEYLRIKQLD